MIRSSIRNKAQFALAALVLLALMNMALGHHMLRKIDAVSGTVMETSELYRLAKRILTTVGHPRAGDPTVRASLFSPIDAEVATWQLSTSLRPGLGDGHTQLAMLWADMVRDWNRVRVRYDAMRRAGSSAEAQAVVELEPLAMDLEASIGAVHYLAAKELEAVYDRLRFAAITLGLIDLLVIGALLVGLRRQVLNPLSRLAEAARDYSGADYRGQFASSDSDEIGDLSRALDRSATRVHSLVDSVQENAERWAKAERMFRSLVEHAGVGVFLIQGGHFRYVNGRFADMAGRTPPAMVTGVGMSECLHSSDRDRVEKLFLACEAGELNNLRFECRFQATAELRECEVHGSRTDFEGSPAVIGTLIDHTERAHADAELRKLSRAIEQTRATVVVTDRAGVIEYVNPYFSELTGYRPEEALGKTPSILKSGLTPPDVYRELWTRISAGEEWSGEILNRKKGGDLFWEHMVVSAVRDSSGEISHFVAVKEDISDRKRAEQELQRLNRTLKVLSESNQNLVHADDELSLLQATCRNLVEIGGYRLAFVGLPEDPHASEVKVVARWGTEDGYLSAVRDFDRGAGPSGTAIREKTTRVVRDIEGDPVYEPYRGEALKRGFQSTIALPLLSGEQALGVLRIYSGEANAFAVDEVKLLCDLAADLAYGMVSLRTRDQRERAEQALRESEQRFRSITASAQDAIVMVDQEGMITYWNPAAERMTGFSEARAVGHALLPKLVPRTHLAKIQAALAELAHSGSGRFVGQTIELTVLRENGSPLSVEASTSAMRLSGRWQLLVLARDVSVRKEAEEALHIRNRAIESSSNAIIIAKSVRGDDNPIIYVNSAFERITGYSKDEVQGRNPRFLLGEDWEQAGIERLRDALRRRNSTRVLLRNYRRDQTGFWAEVSISPVMDDGGRLTHYISVISDVTDRIRAEEELRHRATHDQLTGLANRVLLADRIDQAVAHSARSNRHVAVLLLDLDRFKFINDSLGHGAGDRVVRVAGERLTTCVRRGDTVARIGGDEFAVVLAELGSVSDVPIVAQKIQESLGYPIEVPGQQLFVTTSIGISLAPTDGSEAETLLRNADIAMYAAKDQGGNCARFYQEGMNDRARRQLSLEADLRRAVDRGELLLYYQPKLDLRLRRVTGAEALIRWKHPQRGMIPPLDFIPLAEETGLIVSIGEWALRQACIDAMGWRQRSGECLSVAVNISARQFRHGSLPKTVSEALAVAGLPADGLELELTESMIMQHAETTIAALDELKAIGIRLSIDDFGTGYSSLSYLRHFPVDTLKIDRSFVKDLTESDDSQTVAGTILVLAHGLGMDVVAEGVETREQLEFLESQGCDQIQGYLFSRPLPEPEFYSLYAKSLSAGVVLA